MAKKRVVRKPSWEYDKPPREEIVEIIERLTSKISRAKAIYGDPDRGILPHWESEDGLTLYHIENVTAWRKI